VVSRNTRRSVQVSRSRTAVVVRANLFSRVARLFRSTANNLGELAREISAGFSDKINLLLLESHAGELLTTQMRKNC